MANWKEIGRAARAQAQLAARQLKTKNHRAAAANRLRTVIRCEEKAAEKEYLALGRYYYNALRNGDNAIAEAHCARIDEIQARRDSALESLEQVVQDPNGPEKTSVHVTEGADGPTSVVKTKKRGTLFHFNRGPLEITVTRDQDTEYDPEDENSEEIDLADVESYDQDPMPEILSTQAAELDENDNLPFE